MTQTSSSQHAPQQNAFRNPHSIRQTILARWYPGVRLFPCTPLRIAGMLPVLIVLFILCLAYVTAVPGTLIPLSSIFPFTTFVILILFHFIFISTVFNYLLLVLIDPGSVPPDWKAPTPPTFSSSSSSPPSPTSPTSSPSSQFQYAHLMHDRTAQGYLRYCDICKSYKPDRAHHCSVCKRCILRMDHHCVFVNNCVSFYNHKFFISFVTFAFLGCVIISVISFPTFADIISIPNRSAITTTHSSNNNNAINSTHSSFHFLLSFLIQRPPLTTLIRLDTFALYSAAPHLPTLMKTAVMIGYIVSSAFSFALGVFVTLHCYLVSKGRTTIEMYEMTDPIRSPLVAKYDLGFRRNLKTVCGTVPLCWLCPTRAFIEGDGIQYQRRESTQATLTEP